MWQSLISVSALCSSVVVREPRLLALPQPRRAPLLELQLPLRRVAARL
jgi:hypothetical protein